MDVSTGGSFVRTWCLSKVLAMSTCSRARELEIAASGHDLYAGELSVIAAGRGDRGGVSGVVREPTIFRGLSEFVLDRQGRQRYRIIALVDDDAAGRRAISTARSLDTSVREYRDLFRIRPAMPTRGNLDPATLSRTFERLNEQYNRIDWEIEDLLPVDLVESLIDEHPSSLIRRDDVAGKVHWELTRDGKGGAASHLPAYARDPRRPKCSSRSYPIGSFSPQH